MLKKALLFIILPQGNSIREMEYVNYVKFMFFIDYELKIYKNIYKIR